MSECSDTNLVFQTTVFLITVVRINERSPGIKSRQATAFPEFVDITVIVVMFLLVTILWIVSTCDYCFFADFLIVRLRPLIVKIRKINPNQISWHTLLVLFTWYISFSVQLEAHQHNCKYYWVNEQKLKPELCIEKRVFRNRSHTHEHQELRSCNRSHIREKKSSGVGAVLPEPWNFNFGLFTQES